MPQAINFIVKNAANADKTFELLQPAAGNGSIAEWAIKDGPVSTAFPRFTASSNRTPVSQILTEKIRYPVTFTDVSTGLTQQLCKPAELHVKCVMPHDFPEGKKDDFLAIATNAIASAFNKSQLRDARAGN